ncbi:hypothetical protein [Desulfosporosinus sp. SB140]|uniref:hypothetical protein n=1 Tax=Desulfosporosinus paludis TaxID=3115649 RepID=UPI00388F72F4
MGRKTEFDEALALKLYHEGKNDREIGRLINVNHHAIFGWRSRRNLPSNVIKSTNHKIETTTPKTYRDVLTPEQAEEMDKFLRALSWAGCKAVQAGVKPDIANFINAYAGRTNEENRKQYNKMLMRKIRVKSKQAAG